MQDRVGEGKDGRVTRLVCGAHDTLVTRTERGSGSSYALALAVNSPSPHPTIPQMLGLRHPGLWSYHHCLLLGPYPSPPPPSRPWLSVPPLPLVRGEVQTVHGGV